MNARYGVEVRAALRQALSAPIVAPGRRLDRQVLGRAQIEMLLPQRDPLLLIDRVTHVDAATGVIVCQYDLARATTLLRGHFPERPLWPGVLQVEAVGQAGLCLVRLRRRTEAQAEAAMEGGFALTDVLGARFLRPVIPPDDVEIVARVLADGLFTIVIGQCLQKGAICSVAAVRGIEQEKKDDA